MWPHISIPHILWAAGGAFLVYPVSKLWEMWVSKFWRGFWIGLKAGFKDTPAGKQIADAFMASYNKAKTERKTKFVAKHPELKEALEEIEKTEEKS